MRLSLLYVLSVPYVAGLGCFGGPAIGGFRLTGWVFVVMLATAPFVYIFDRTPNRFPFTFWLPWVGIVFLSITWVDKIGRWQVQDAFQIVTPFVIAPIASIAIKDQRDVDKLLRSFTHCLLILLGATALYFLAGADVLVRPMALTAALVGCVFIAQIWERPTTAIMGWLGCLLITGLTGGRIATLALLMEWILIPGLQRVWTRVMIVTSIAVAAIVLFYTPIFQQRFFGDEGGTIADLRRGEYITSGRRKAWPELFEDVKQQPWFGAGISSSGALTRQVWGQVNKPHNDYLRILLEQGVIGLLCFLYGVIRQLLDLRKGLLRQHVRGVILRRAAFLGFLVLLVVMYTDNPIIYGVWFMHPLLVVAGAAYSPGAGTLIRGGKRSPA